MATAAALALAVLVGSAPARGERVVAIGDVHGAHESFRGILEAAGLIDDSGLWRGGDTTFVQTGDLTDRGVRVREVLDLMIDLQRQAPATGGRVIALLGNHEINNLVGYRADVAMQGKPPAEVYATFAGADAEALRKKALKQWNRWRRRFPTCTVSDRDQWLAAHPPGYVEYAQAFGVDGRYGRWLRTLPVVARVGDTIFLHGGLSPELPELHGAADLDAINARVAEEIAQWDRDRATLEKAGIVVPTSELGEVLCAIDYQLAVLAAQPDDARAQAERARLAELRGRLPSSSSWLSFAGEGPLWYRGFAQWNDEEGPGLLDRVASIFGGSRFVVGHTPQVTGIVSRFGGRLFLIDTAMVFGAAAGGRAAALELDGDAAWAIYRDVRVPLTSDAEREVRPAAGGMVGLAAADDRRRAVAMAASSAPQEAPARRQWLGPDGESLPFASDEELRRFLTEATVVSMDDIPVGITRPKRLVLEKDGVRARAAFRHVDFVTDRYRLSSGKMVLFFRDSFINEVAAYELARLMGLDNVPPAVLRQVRREKGSVQIWVEQAMTEQGRREDGVAPPDRLRFNRQFFEMRVFDNLIHNIDRNQGNILFDRDWRLWMIDHTRAFARDKRLSAPDDVVQLSRRFWERLQTVADADIERTLEPYLNPAEIQALLVRRRHLIEAIEQRIAARTEARVLFDYGDPPPSSVTITPIEVPPPPADG